MSYHVIGHIWAVLKNLITLLFVFALFDYASNPFETIVFASLLMIYLQIASFMTTWGKGTMEMTFATADEFIQIKRLLPNYKEELRKGDEENLKQAKEQTKYIHVRYWINAGFMSIFWIIALYNLVFAIW
ncbi:MAG: hypothetical protein WC840_03395 [Candidatus Peribacteraceae bacterium]